MKGNSVKYVCRECGHEETKWAGKCPECGRIYKISDSRNKKNKLSGDLKCVKCKLFNKRYPRMKYVTIFGDTITYQGSLELKFIKKLLFLLKKC